MIVSGLLFLCVWFAQDKVCLFMPWQIDTLCLIFSRVLLVVWPRKICCFSVMLK